MKKSIKKVSFDFLSLALLVALDLSLKWTTKDLVWSFWLSSICVGYLTIVSSVLKLPLFVHAKKEEHNFQDKLPKHINLILGGFSLFLIGFFSIHFLGFHLGHSIFLKSAFPLEGFTSKSSGLVDFGYLKDILFYLMPQYWCFVLVSLFNKRDIFNKDIENFDLRSISIGPYQNVIKIHLLIFVIVGLRALEIQDLVIHSVVLIVFVTDFSGVMGKKIKKARRLKKKRRQRDKSAA